ncbi:MAG: insulinase family protein [Muribaculaceae bacterium]|nr:insulinase family protein [Muribaculaceae bacterium]
MKTSNNSEEYRYHTLGNGLRIVHCMHGGDVAYCGLAVKAGSANEDTSQFGLAHFVEHTLFKGTTHRKSYHIINRMERVGGELNAYTSKEETMIYSTFPAQYYERAIELMSDLIANSIFPADELEREREVVIDELQSYRDIPAEAVYDDFEDCFFAGTPLGHNILGNESSISGLTSQDCTRFIKKWYVPENMIFFSYGKLDFDLLCRYMEKHFGHLHYSLERCDDDPVAGAVNPPFHKRESIDSHQSHTIYGAHVSSIYGSDRYTLALLNNILGGPGMNSLLNVSLREKHGYVYTVESAITHYMNDGLFSIYFGCDHQNVSKCLRLIGNTIARLSDTLLSPSALAMAKRQYTGQLLVASDNKENVALAMGKSMLYHGSVQDSVTTYNRIMEVTAEDIRRASSLLIPDRASILTFSE